MALPLLSDSLASAAQSELPSSLGAGIPGLEQAELVLPFFGASCCSDSEGGGRVV